MTEPIVLPTEREDVVLRQFATEADDRAYVDMVQANAEHLSEFNQRTVKEYRTAADAKIERERAEVTGKLRFGIWDGDDLVGTINLTPRDELVAEVGYWLDGENQGKGYMGVALGGLMKFCESRFEVLYASVNNINRRSANVLLRAGFQLVDRVEDDEIFEYPPSA